MLAKKVSQQQKAIAYLKQKYKEKTGQEIIMPKRWQDYLLMDEDQVPVQSLPQVQKREKTNKGQTYSTFEQKFNKYQLPSRISYTKLPFTNFSATNPFHMIEVIQLNGFKEKVNFTLMKGFSKVGLRELLNRILEMRCLKSINLSQNGIDETFAEEIQTLLGMKRISRLDLSSNMMGKTCLQIISKNFNHLQWIDISRNGWTFQFFTLQSLLSAIRTNTKLYHLCLSLQDERLVKQLCSMLKIKTNITYFLRINCRSFELIDSKHDIETMTNIAGVLQPLQGKKQNPNRIINLNFKFCYLDTQPFAILVKSLSNNLSLISLNLSNNQLMETKAITLLNVIGSHLSLTFLDLSSNELQDKFALKLAQVLVKNLILQQVIIDKNNIGDQGAKQICKTLTQHNQTLQTLGKIQTNQRISSQYVQKITKALRINKVSKEIRVQLSSMQGELSAVQIANKQTQAFLQAEYQQFELLEPIAITNPLKDDPYKINLWEFD